MTVNEKWSPEHCDHPASLAQEIKTSRCNLKGLPLLGTDYVYTSAWGYAGFSDMPICKA